MKKGCLLFIVVLICLFHTACRKEKNFPSWETDILTPLVKSTLSIEQLLSDSLIQVNSDSSLKIAYHNEFYHLEMDSLIIIPDTTLNSSISYPWFSSIKLPAGHVLIDNTAESKYNLDGVELKTLKLKSCTIRIEAKNEFKEKIKVTYGIPCATINSIPFEVIEQVPAASASGPGYFMKEYSLAGYDVDLKGADGLQVNILRMSVKAEMLDSVTVFQEDSFIVDHSYFNILPLNARGYFGQNTLAVGPDESSFGLFNKLMSGSLLLESADINIQVENYVGMDARIIINNLSSINTKSSTDIDLTAPLINSPININRATETGGFASSVTPTLWGTLLNNSNSNCKSLIENLPDKLGYSLKIITNPLGNVSGSNDFVFSEQTIKAFLDLEIPLSLVATELTLADTLDFSFPDNQKYEGVNKSAFTLFADNGFPFDATIQLYLLDNSGGIADSLLKGTTVIASGIVNGNLRVTNKKLTKIPIALDEEKMNSLKSSKKMLVKIKYNTVNNPQLLKIYSDYTIDVKLVGDFNYTVNGD